MTIKRKSEGNVSSSLDSSSTAVKRSRYSKGSGFLHRNSHDQRMVKPMVDASSGQTGAFPGLDDLHDDGEQDFVDDGDAVATDDDDPTSTRAALRYLRSVRNEAKTIPRLLVTAKAELWTDGGIVYEDAPSGSGFYEDGAYIAAPIMGPIMPAQWKTESASSSYLQDSSSASHVHVTAQAACSRQLLSNFALQRQQIESTRCKSLQAQDISFRGGIKALQEIVFNFTPETERVASLSQDTLLRMLKIAAKCLKRYRNLSPRFSAWIWSMFCALNDVGTLDSDAVSVIREFGKKAIWMGIGFIGVEEADATAAYCDEDEDEQDENDAITSPTGATELNSRQRLDQETATEERRVQDSNEAASRGRRRNTSSPNPLGLDVFEPATVAATCATANNDDSKARELAKVISMAENGVTTILTTQPPAKERCPDENTCATIDMIVTIVGEVYGQRDLLEFRTAWSGLWG